MLAAEDHIILPHCGAQDKDQEVVRDTIDPRGGAGNF